MSERKAAEFQTLTNYVRNFKAIKPWMEHHCNNCEKLSRCKTAVVKSCSNWKPMNKKVIELTGECFAKLENDQVTTYLVCHCFSGPHEHKRCDGKCKRVVLHATIIGKAKYHGLRDAGRA